MTSKRKTRRGRQIRTLAHLHAVLNRQQYLYVHGKPLHPGWVRSWQFGMVLAYLGRGLMYEASCADSRQPYIAPDYWTGE